MLGNQRIQAFRLSYFREDGIFVNVKLVFCDLRMGNNEADGLVLRVSVDLISMLNIWVAAIVELRAVLMKNAAMVVLGVELDKLGLIGCFNNII